LASTFNDVKKGQVDPKTGNCLGLLAGQLLRALQGDNLANEIEALRADVERVKNERSNAETAGPQVASGAGDLHGDAGADPDPAADEPGSLDGESGLPAGPLAADAVDEDIIADITPMFG
jgi:hypothetical protein